jgi:hypothetical protein
MSETVKIKINLSSVNWEDKFPGARVFINDQVVLEKLITEPTEIEWTGVVEFKQNKITIEMYNKVDSYTVQDENNQIVKDVLLNIENISIEDIDLDRILHTNSTYYPQHEFAPGVIKECVNLGWNGRWEIEFTTPVYLWFLENL